MANPAGFAAVSSSVTPTAPIAAHRSTRDGMKFTEGDFVRWFDADFQVMRYGRVTKVSGKRIGFADHDQDADGEWEATGQERELPAGELAQLDELPSEHGEKWADRGVVRGQVAQGITEGGPSTQREVLIELGIQEATEQETLHGERAAGEGEGSDEETADESSSAATLDDQAQAQRDVSLSDRISRIYRAFYDRFDDVWNGIEFYVKDVYSDSVVAYARHDEAYYRVGYEWDEDRGGADFAEPEEWQEVTQEWVDVEDGRTVEELAEAKAALREGGAVLVGGDERGGIGSILASRRAPAGHVKQGRQQIRDGEPYYRDFAGWDPPHPQIRKSSDGQRLTVTVNTTDEDRHGTIILPTGARLERYNSGNPIVLINHDHTLPAATSSVGIRGDGLAADLQANVEEDDWDLEDEEIARWHRKVTRDNPIVRSASIGALFHEWMPGREFDSIETLLGREVRPNERLPRVITDWELLEWSFVSVPSNPSATVDARRLERRLQQSLIGLEQRLAEHSQRQLAAATVAPSTPKQDTPAKREEVPAEAARSGETDSPQPTPAENGDGAEPSEKEEIIPLNDASRLVATMRAKRKEKAKQKAKRLLGRA